MTPTRIFALVCALGLLIAAAVAQEPPPKEAAPPSDAISAQLEKEFGEVMDRAKRETINAVDGDFIKAYGKAKAAQGLRVLAQRQTALPEKDLKERRLQEVLDASGRVLAEFNARGRQASFRVEDEHLLPAFARALSVLGAAEYLKPEYTKEMKEEAVKRVADEFKLYLTAFNEQGHDAYWKDDVDRHVKSFLLAKDAVEAIEWTAAPTVVATLGEARVGEAKNSAEQLLEDFNAHGKYAQPGTAASFKVDVFLTVAIAADILKKSETLGAASPQTDK
ncbi:MAG: hypothetical protein AAB658_03280, partial [Chloroflexota bacterium]